MRCLCLPDVLYDCICKDKWTMKGSHQARYVWDVLKENQKDFEMLDEQRDLIE